MIEPSILTPKYMELKIFVKWILYTFCHFLGVKVIMFSINFKKSVTFSLKTHYTKSAAPESQPFNRGMVVYCVYLLINKHIYTLVNCIFSHSPQFLHFLMVGSRYSSSIFLLALLSMTFYTQHVFWNIRKKNKFLGVCVYALIYHTIFKLPVKTGVIWAGNFGCMLIHSSIIGEFTWKHLYRYLCVSFFHPYFPPCVWLGTHLGSALISLGVNMRRY